MKMFLASALAVLINVLSVQCYNILYVSTIPSPSHHRLAQGYYNILLSRGHKITSISPFRSKAPHENLTDITLGFIMDSIPLETTYIPFYMNRGRRDEIHEWIQLVNDGCRQALLDDGVQKLVNDKSQTFDLVIVDWLHADILAGFSAVYQCPFVWSSSLDAHPALLAMVDDIGNPAYTDHVMISHDKPLTLAQRVAMLWETLKIASVVESLRPEDAIVYKKAFAKAASQRGLVLPPYEDLIYNASLVLMNSHPSYGSSNRLPQNIKTVAGFYIEDPPPPLPETLRKVIEASKHGVIYFSFGSNAKSKDLPLPVRNDLLRLFAQLKQTVLWKFEEDLPDLPKNVYTMKWMPQSSILAHPNTKIFITHGGIFSTTESINYGVPTIGVPIFGDQYANMEKAVRNGNALKVDLTDNLARDLEKAIHEMLVNTSYMDRARHISSLYHDRPIKPQEELLYWVEYVIRNRGAPHLKSTALLLPWYSRFYVDLLLIILGVILTLACSLVLLISKIYVRKVKVE